MGKIILSSNIHHYKHKAEALHESGFLQKYITGLYLTKDSLLYKLLPKKYLGLFSNYINLSIKKKSVRSFVFLELIYKYLLKKGFFNRKKTILKYNQMFDYFASKNIDKCDIFHVVSSIGFRSATYAKEKGALVLLDERAEHPLFLEEILKEEYSLLGIDNINYLNNIFWKDSVLQEYQIADYFVVASNFVKRTFVEKGIESDKIFVVPYGCDTHKFRKIDKSDDVFRVIYVGQITPRKGIIYLIEAFKKLSLENTELVLIGSIDQTMLGIFEKLPNNIKHYKYIPNHELYKYYSNSSIFVLPSLSDAFGLVVLEAMACGLPVIASENVGAADLIKNNENGFVVPIRNSEEIYKKLLLLSEDKELLTQMQKNALATANEYNWNRYKKEIKDIYHLLSRENRDTKEILMINE